jgi:hypothetical protein
MEGRRNYFEDAFLHHGRHGLPALTEEGLQEPTMGILEEF